MIEDDKSFTVTIGKIIQPLQNNQHEEVQSLLCSMQCDAERVVEAENHLNSMAIRSLGK